MNTNTTLYAGVAARTFEYDHLCLGPRPLVDTVVPMRGVVALISAPLLAAVGAVSLALPAPAHADTDDDTAFLNAIHARGLPDSRNGESTIEVAHAICKLLGTGYTINGLASAGALHAVGLSADDAKFLVQTSAAAYCPQYIH